ncbi:hypothetical protein [Muricoccus aerilatus]|uniref:hypothetical protein n=1 Tax=Muricoccus aerilatus TaxID=452982 RepID=UPI000AC9F38D|nr:hypothetical protein [Roseomonas aerilata]
MDLFSPWWRVSHPGSSLALAVVTVAAVAALILFEYVLDWPVVMETERASETGRSQG